VNGRNRRRIIDSAAVRCGCSPCSMGMTDPLRQDLWTAMRASGDTTGLATIYRALHALTDAGLVHQFRRDTETTYRACDPGHHDHLVCRTCGRVQERRTGGLDHQLSQLSQDGFAAEDCLIEIYGRCSTCP